MAFPTAVNSQITDAITQTNVKTVDEAPATAVGAIRQSVANAAGDVAENAKSTQQAMDQLSDQALEEDRD